MTNTITSQADEVSQSVVGEVVTFDSQETVITSTIETPADSNAISSEAETESVSITTTETVSIATEEESVVHSFESTPPKGEKGDKGDPGSNVSSGVLEGDILRWNATLGAWESSSEPFEFGQIVLTPAIAAILDKEGSLWYDSNNKCVMVCTDDH